MSKILAIDTSCDDSSASVLEGQVVLSNIVASQNQIHQKYGGVFPTLAKQAHKINLGPAIETAMKKAQVKWSGLDAIAVTVGPGLAPALEVGINKAKELAKEHGKKLIAINHIEAHALSPLAQANSKIGKKSKEKQSFPVLALVISGGHSDFIWVNKIGDYQKIGQTIDDAAGECLDKVGRLLNLGYPAGPLMEKFAQKGQPGKFQFPKAMTSQANFDLSFSGLKTSARNLITDLESKNKLDRQTIYDLSYALQKAVFDQIVYKLERILYSSDPVKGVYPDRHFMKNLSKENIIPSQIEEIWLGGGVAANSRLRQKIRKLLRDYAKVSKKSSKKIKLRVPYSKKLCGDNAAMIGLVAGYKFERKEFARPDKTDRQPNLSI